MQPAPTKRSDNRKGFTLIELSIVLTIIGLLVGGIIGARALIRASEMRSLITNFEDLRIAVRQFNTQYSGLPGDLRNATRFWGALDADPATCNSRAANGKLTCDGNGDEKIYVAEYWEKHRFWQHLSNSELIPGNYTGKPGSGHTMRVIVGVNAPGTSIPGVGWSFDESGDTAKANYWNRRDVGNSWVLGKETSLYSTEGPAFTVSEIWNMDKKIDDGLPGAGIVQTTPYLAVDPATGVSDRSAFRTSIYNLSTETLGQITFVNLF